MRSTIIPPVIIAAIVSIFIACELSARFQILSVYRTCFLQLLGAILIQLVKFLTSLLH